MRHLAADVDEGVVGADRVRGVDAALDERVRVGEHERDVLAGTRLGLVGVDDEVVRLAVVLRDEAPLHAGREAGAATAAQAGVLDQGDDVVGVHAEGHGDHVVAAVTAVALERVGVGVVPVRGEDRGQRHGSALRRLERARRTGIATGAAGADMPCSLRVGAARRASGSSLPPSSASPSSKPARVRSIASKVPMRGPRVERTSSPACSRSTTSSARGDVHVVEELPVDGHRPARGCRPPGTRCARGRTRRRR